MTTMKKIINRVKMGIYSRIQSAQGGVENCTVNWDIMNPDIVRKYYVFDEILDGKVESRPKTLKELATGFLDDVKLYGYFDKELVSVFNEVSRCCTPHGKSPRLYYHTDNGVMWCLQLTTGMSRVYLAHVDLDPLLIACRDAMTTERWNECRDRIEENLISTLPQYECYWKFTALL